MKFAELTIHEKILLRGNMTISHGRNHLSSWYNYFELPISEHPRPRRGNFKEIEHRNINKCWKSGHTLFWLYGRPEQRIDHTTVEINKKSQRHESKVVRTEVITATAGPYGYAGIPWWNLQTMPIKRRRSKNTSQQITLWRS